MTQTRPADPTEQTPVGHIGLRAPRVPALDPTLPWYSVNGTEHDSKLGPICRPIEPVTMSLDEVQEIVEAEGESLPPGWRESLLRGETVRASGECEVEVCP